jgi:hypothetical protein
MHGERKNVFLRLEDRRRAVSLMHIEIDHCRALDRTLRLQLAYGDGHIIEYAEPLAMIGERMMSAAGQIAGKTVLERRARGQQGPGRGKTRSLPQSLRPGKAEPPLLGRGKRRCTELRQVLGRMHELQGRRVERLRLQQVAGDQYSFRQELILE